MVKSVGEIIRQWMEEYPEPAPANERQCTYIRSDGQRCDACGRLPSPERGDGSVLVCDHNPATGRHRGRLCGRCSAALGLLDEDASLIEALAVYLNERASKHDWAGDWE